MKNLNYARITFAEPNHFILDGEDYRLATYPHNEESTPDGLVKHMTNQQTHKTYLVYKSDVLATNRTAALAIWSQT